MNGIVNLNKPKGKTSHDMVYFLRRLTGVRRVGHTGTLDPDATGVLPMCIGTATKAAEYLTAQQKSYRAQMVLGASTDTLDSSGIILERRSISVTRGQIEETVKRFIGTIEQIPPMYSAIKVDGKKLYELAREGKQVARKARTVQIDRIEILDIDLVSGAVVMDIDCSKGTYIRSLCADIGEALGCLAHMGSLVRTRSGRFTIEESYTTGQLEQLQTIGRLSEAILPIDAVFAQYEALNVSGRNEFKVRNGTPLVLGALTEGAFYRIYGEDGSFLCISQQQDGRLVMQKAFWQI